MSLTDLKSMCQHSCVFFWRLQGKILFLAFSNFQRLPTFLGSKPAMTKLSIHCITMTLTLLPPSFTYGICTITLAHADNPGKSHIKISCLTILIPPCRASLHIYRFCGQDLDTFGDPLFCIPPHVQNLWGEEDDSAIRTSPVKLQKRGRVGPWHYGGHSNAEPEPSTTYKHVLLGLDIDDTMVITHYSQNSNGALLWGLWPAV